MTNTQVKDNAEKIQQPNKPTLFDKLAGDSAYVPESLTPVLPNELVGGSVPYITGMEEEAVWNAAAQACGTERVHYIYTVENNRCWYLALPSSALASYPHCWIKKRCMSTNRKVRPVPYVGILKQAVCSCFWGQYVPFYRAFKAWMRTL
jgi:hypothetical protein